ncbi:hypothetical protein ACG23B_004377 [Salmonella enterica subsp. enterica serovar Anatum]
MVHKPLFGLCRPRRYWHLLIVASLNLVIFVLLTDAAKENLSESSFVGNVMNVGNVK